MQQTGESLCLHCGCAGLRTGNKAERETVVKRVCKVIFICLALMPAWCLAMSVVFINPGKKDEIFWLTAARSMEAAASDLGIRLEVIYAERNHLNALLFARQLAERPRGQRPDYLILSNDVLQIKRHHCKM